MIQRSVKTEAPERQELHRLMEAQCTRVMTKQDEIPRTEKPRTHHEYYLFVEDDSGYLIEQREECTICERHKYQPSFTQGSYNRS